MFLILHNESTLLGWEGQYWPLFQVSSQCSYQSNNTCKEEQEWYTKNVFDFYLLYTYLNVLKSNINLNLSILSYLENMIQTKIQKLIIEGTS
jgi:hypothetical protein